MINRFLLVLVVLIAQAIPTTAESREKDLDRWVDRDLIPHVRQQLLVHPRFKGETVMFVVLKDNAPTPVSNALAISLRDRLLDAAVNTPGVSVGWRQGRTGASPTAQAIDCTRDEVHYYIGIELAQELDSSYTVAVRALDLEDRNWVTGFGRSWRGQLGTIQRQAMRQARIDTTFRGSRDVPFSLAETDLLAAHLAHDLSCALLRQSNDEYIVAATKSAAVNDELAGTVELVSNNLANHEAIELAAKDSAVNARLHGKAHRIDGPLFQYWLTVTPTGDSELSALSSSAYVLLPDYALAHSGVDENRRPPAPAVAIVPRQPTAAKMAVSIPNAGKDALLGPLKVAAPSSLSECGGRSIVRRTSYLQSRSACSVLQANPKSDAIVFFLQHQANHGLVRLGGAECRERTVASIASTGTPMRFPIPRTTAGDGSAETYEWLVAPELDTYYAIALTDARAARNIANHIDHLPMRCSDAVRPGLVDAELQEWLDEFALLAASSPRHFDWRALQVKDVL